MAVINDLIKNRARRAVAAIAGPTRVRAAFLFGSQANGSSDACSDLDIAAFVDHFDRWKLDQRIKTLISVQKEIGDDVDLHFFSSDALHNPPAAGFAAYVQKHGVRIDIEDSVAMTNGHPQNP